MRVSMSLGLFVIILCVASCVAGNNKKKNRPKKERSAVQPLENCMNPPTKQLRIQLRHLLRRQNGLGNVFVAPVSGGQNNNEASSSSDARDGQRQAVPHVSSDELPRNTYCMETSRTNVDNNRYPVSYNFVTCECVDCVNEHGIEFARCAPIEYRMKVLKLSETEPCYNGLFQFEKRNEIITVGCRLVPNF